MSQGRGDLVEDSGDCHYRGQSHSTVDLPWQGADRADEKTGLFKYVCSLPDGVPFRKVVSDVFGAGADSGGAEYQLARRFFKRHSEYFKTDRRGGLLWVEPRTEAFHLRPQYAKRKTSVGRGDGVGDRDDLLGDGCSSGSGGLSDGDDHQGERGDGRADSPQYPKDRVGAVLDKYVQFPSDSVKQSFLREFVTERGEIDDKWQVFKRVRGQGDDYLCLPYRTRHNDGVRAGDVRDGFEHALQAASGRHNRAVVLTVTTDPKQHDSLTAALNSLAENKGRLLSWLATEYQLGYRPENLSALQFSRNGLPHYHIVLFGVSWAVTQERLSAQWQSYGQGKVVDCRTAETAHDGTQWLLHDDSQGKVSLSYYLGKAIRGLEDIAEMDAGDLGDRVDGGDISLWRQVLYWATGRQYYSCSPSLKRPTPDDSLPQVTVWQFVGAAQYQDIPAHVRRGARFAGLPPPANSGEQSGVG